MVSAAEQKALGNFAYACVASDYIRLVRRTNPEVNLRPLFNELLTFLADNPLSDTLLPLLDLVELGCKFPAGIQITDNPKLVIEASTEQATADTTEPTGNASEDPAQT